MATPVNFKFVQWLDEWAHKAQEINNQNMYWVYRKAASNLRKETSALTAKQLIRVPGIGQTIVKKIETKLKAFLEEEDGSVDEIYLAGHLPVVNSVPVANSQAEGATSESIVDKPKKKRAPTTKQYMPTFRSGGYAILVAMYKISLERSQDELISRTHIVSVASEYCDASFCAGTSKNSAYSAWASMNTLIKKDLIYKRGSPAKYCLTVTGKELAESLWNRTEMMATELSQPQECPGISQPLPIIQSSISNISTENAKRKLEILEPPLKSSVFEFNYLDSDNKVAATKDKAFVQLKEPDRKCTFKIQYPNSCSLHPFCSRVLKGSLVPDAEGMLIGYLYDDDAPDRCPGVSSTSSAKIPSRLPLAERSVFGKKLKAFDDAEASTMVKDKTLPKCPWPLMKKVFSKDFVPTTEFSPIVMSPNEYDIVLIMDNRERSASIPNFLEKNRVLYANRVLEVGDVAWIARSNNNSSLSRPVEVVLDFIVERKRVDDLVSSIKSGRFKEQKTRLAHCSLSKIFYLLEDIPAGNYGVESFGSDRVRSAVALTQVLDDVHVHRASSFEEGLEFILKLHKIVLKHYSNKHIYALPHSLLEKSSFLQLKEALEERDNRHYHLLFESFSELNTKTKVLTLRDLWLKQLLCIRGLSADKAIKIVEKYPTPRSLLTVLESEPHKENKIRLLKNLDPLVSKNNIGDALARKIIDIFQSGSYTD